MKKIKLEMSIKYSEVEEHDSSSGTESKPVEIFWTPLELEKCQLVDDRGHTHFMIASGDASKPIPQSAPMIDRRVLLGFLKHVESTMLLGPDPQITVDV